MLVDRSRSMNFPVEPGGETRVEAAARFVGASRPGLDALAAEATVEGWGFARDAWPADLAALSRPEPATGGATDILAALRGAAGGSGAPGRRLAGVLLVTDGADNGALAAGLAGQARADLLALGVPVNVVAVGHRRPARPRRRAGRRGRLRLRPQHRHRRGHAARPRASAART